MLSGFERLQRLADKEINFVSIKNSMMSASVGFAAVLTNTQAKRAEERLWMRGLGMGGSDRGVGGAHI